MTSGSGVVAAKALEVLATLSYDRNQVAAAVGCHRRTVARWEAGQFSPNRRNRTALRALVGELLMAENAGPDNARTRSRIKRLELAGEALMTSVEKAKRAEFEQEMRQRYEAVVAERQPESPSAYATVDPFRIFGQQDRELAAVEAVFA